MAESDWERNQSEESFRYFCRGLKTFWELVRDYKRAIYGCLFWLVLMTVFELISPYLMKLVFDELPQVLSDGKFTLYVALLIIAWFFARVIGSAVRLYGRDIAFIRVMINFENTLPQKAQSKLLDLSPGYHFRENTGKKIEKINKGCNKIIQIMDILYWGLLPGLLFLVLNCAVVLMIDWKIGLIYILPIMPAVCLIFKVHKKSAPKWERYEELRERSAGYFCQSILNVQTVQTFVQEKREKDQIKVIRDEMIENDCQTSLMQQKYFFGIDQVLQIPVMLAIVLSLYFVSQGKSTVGTVVYVLMTGNTIIGGIWGLVHNYNNIIRNLYAVNRMKLLLDEPLEIVNHPDTIVPEVFAGDIEMKNISFAYPEKVNIFDNFSLSFKLNKMTALVGRSASGKTTLARLLARMYDPAQGQIILNGQDIKMIDKDWYRRQFAVVKQDIDIFDATLGDNVSYAYPQATAEQVQESIKAANMDMDLANSDKFPDGIQTQVGERGVQLSGGERQRVGIARAYLALLGGANVLILDEATSNLDSESEKAIQNMLDKLRENKSVTIVAIAHRLSTIARADMIYVIDKGQLLEQGDHQRLINKNGLYAKLVELQKIGYLRE